MSETSETCPDCNGTGAIGPWTHKLEYGPDDIPVRIDILEECYDSVLDLPAHCDGDHPYYDRKYASERALRDTLKAMLPPRKT